MHYLIWDLKLTLAKKERTLFLKRMRKEDFIHIVCTVYLIIIENAWIIQVYNVASTFC